jgi:predicted TIM-barrel fold metal-dependent hydrolase
MKLKTSKKHDSLLKIPVTFHSDFNEYYISPYKILNLARKFPDIPVLLAHIGLDYRQMWDFIKTKEVRIQDNLFIETSGTPMIPRLIKKSCEFVGPQRVVFGSESHVCPTELAILKIRLAKLTERIIRARARSIPIKPPV